MTIQMTIKTPSRITRDAKDRPSVMEDTFCASKANSMGESAGKKYCDYHGLCYHDTSKCNLDKSCKKHIQPAHRITEQQRLWQVRFIKDAKRRQETRPDRPRGQGPER
eukprot:3730677-Ditylum_brightwellii.AAC.1